MATRLKKSNSNTRIIKSFIVFLFIIGISVFYFTGIWLISNSTKWGTTPFFEETYRDTYTFRNKFDNLLYYAVETNVVYKSQGNIEDGKAINEDDLIQKFKEYYNVADGIITSNTEIVNDKLVLTGSIPDYLQENYKEYEYLVNNRLSTYRKIYIQNQLDTYNFQMDELSSYKNFYYCIEDENGNIIAQNKDKEEILKFNNHFIQQGDFTTDKMGGVLFSDFYSKNISIKNYKLYAGVPDVFEEGDIFYTENEAFSNFATCTPYLFSVFFLSLICCILMSVYLIRMAGQNERRGEVTLSTLDKLYNDIHFWLSAISIFILLLIFTTLMNPAVYYNENTMISYTAIGIQYISVLISSLIGLSFLCSMSRQIKAHQFIRNTLFVSIIIKVGSFLSNKSFKGWIVFTAFIYTLINIILLSLTLFLRYNFILFIFFGLTLIAFNIICLIILLKSLESLSIIMNTAREISTGNFNDTIDIKKISPSFISFAKDIINIQQGLKTAVEEAVKGERMKAELITNVSHDLKTPLTSIITYIDLLKKEELNNKQADGYVEILNDKALRLKRLIEDLIEASKASSGNLKVTKQRIDLRQLVMMASGEFEEKMNNAGISLKINAEEETIIEADGNHMWRIIENLISNALKYSMPNSRVYIDIFKTDTLGILIMKNISEIPLEISPERLTERFVRGDESRTTEGSGLGLSITKSLSILQGGDFSISIDGDLFKATVKMPLWKDNEDQNIESTNNIVEQ